MERNSGNIRILPAGDQALVAEFGDKIDPSINDRVQSLASNILESKVRGVTELVPTFRSLLVCYQPSVIGYEALRETVLLLAGHPDTAISAQRRMLKIPCCYGSHFGPDLADLERYTGIDRDEIIRIHSGADYRVYMLGFLPGFAYLGGLDERIAMPRLATPRVKIPKGAVGIGGNQTGVYPLESPGGWRLIGNTPLDFYDPNRKEPVLCRAGDIIRFFPITSADYYDIRRMVAQGSYHPEVEIF
ncbi:MAG: 5-oxoprolinase subunit PxpB [Lachnospiraceae bacterium]|nr:5-oxoprolinase subunit PxpB [Lachnospiraceae bacterium]